MSANISFEYGRTRIEVISIPARHPPLHSPRNAGRCPHRSYQEKGRPTEWPSFHPGNTNGNKSLMSRSTCDQMRVRPSGDNDNPCAGR
jgi:hypothetical protein